MDDGDYRDDYIELENYYNLQEQLYYLIYLFTTMTI